MRDTDNYYVALDDEGNVTSLVLAQGNYDALKKDMPTRYKDTKFVLIQHNKPEVAPNQAINYTGWSQKEDGTVSYDWEVTTFTQEECLNLWVRIPREIRLARSDWTQTADAPLTAEQKAEWATYRQALRDMTTTYADVSDPATIVWPLAPNAPEFVNPDDPA